MSIPYFQRAFQVVITLQNGQTITASTTDNLLECTFDIEFSREVYAYANVALYNLDQTTAQQVCQYGDKISVYAGYEFNDGQNNLIFQGTVFQTFLEKENNVDLKFTVRSYIFLLEDNQNPINITLPKNSTAYDAFQQIASAAGLTATNVDQGALTSKTYARGTVFSGRPTKLLADLAEDANAWFWIANNGVNLRQFTIDSSTTPDIIYCPSNDGINANTVSNAKPILIGTPRQTPMGVDFTVLLDSQLQIGSAVQLVNTYYVLAQQSINSTLYAPIKADGIYRVASLRYTGSTRGNEWYAEVVAVTNPLAAYGLS